MLHSPRAEEMYRYLVDKYFVEQVALNADFETPLLLPYTSFGWPGHASTSVGVEVWPRALLEINSRD